MRIAQLEDDLDQANFIEVWLTGTSYKCYLFRSGSHLARELAKVSFDVLILDWEVSGVSGFRVLQWARENSKRTILTFGLTHLSAGVSKCIKTL